MKIKVTRDKWQVTRTKNPATHHPSLITGFTMVEIAISLAIIGIALVAIIGVLPLGMQTQRANREQTLINQDATVLMEAIRSGSRGANDLTNYIIAITNTYTGAAYSNFTDDAQFSAGAKIIGLLSAPEFVDVNGDPIAETDASYSNHIVAFVRAMSGSAEDKPPQSPDSLVRQDSFSYGVAFGNIQNYTPSSWQPQNYFQSAKVSYTNNLPDFPATYWQAVVDCAATDVPGDSTNWLRDRFDEEMAANSHEMRLTFLWPLLPDSQPPQRVHYGTGNWTYRASVAGQLVHDVDTAVTPHLDLYFFQPQSFATNAP